MSRVLLLCPACDEEIVVYDPVSEDLIECESCGVEIRLVEHRTWKAYEVQP